MKLIRRTLLSLALTLSLLLSLSAGALAAADSGSPYADSMQRLADLGVVQGDADGAFRADDVLTRAEAAALLFRGFKLAPVYSVEAPAPVEGKAPAGKIFYSTDTTVAMLDAALLPAAPDAVGTWAETVCNTVLEARLMQPGADGGFAPWGAVTRADFALAVAKAVYGADKELDFLAQAQKDKLFPQALTLDATPITRGEAASLLDAALDGLTIVTVFATSDIHGNMVPYTPSGSKIQVGGSARAAYLFSLRPNAVVVDAGDSPYNTDLANQFKGQSSVDVMNAQGYDATVLGNHDFDYAFENLLDLAKRADYAMLSANTFWKDGTYPDEFKPYIVKELDGVKVAVVGLTDQDSKATTHYTNTTDIAFHDQWKVGAETVSTANAEADVVILLSHLHSQNNDVPNKIQGIDLEIAGGNDIFGRPYNINGTVVVNPGGVGACVNQINLNLKDGQVLGYTFNQILLSDAVPEDPEVKAILDGYQQKLEESMGRVLGTLKSDLPWSSALLRTGEAALGNLAADALLDYMDADIAIQNGGGVRHGLDAGEVTLGDVFAVVPFDNKVTLVEVTGQTVWDALENGVSGYPATDGRFPQVAGIRYTFDGAKPKGERIVSVTLADGTPLDLTAKYRLVCNDFMCGGGDGYTMLNVLNQDVAMAQAATLLNETSDYYRDVVAKYIEKLGEIDPQVEGRITILNPQQNDSKLN